jgi:hypothetical protein
MQGSDVLKKEKNSRWVRTVKVRVGAGSLDLGALRPTVVNENRASSVRLPSMYVNAEPSSSSDRMSRYPGVPTPQDTKGTEPTNK